MECCRMIALFISLLAVMAKGLTFPCWKVAVNHLHRLDRMLLPASLDDYNQFAVEFEKVLNSRDWSNPDSVSESEDGDDGELSPYYRRDHGDDDRSEIAAPEALKRLLKQRYEARKLKDFSLVDALDKRLLRDHGVRAFDHPAIWTRSKAPRAHLRRLVQKKQMQLQKLYGPVGHPYKQVGRETDASGKPLLLLSLPQVHTSLSRRIRCRIEGRYEEADAIKFELSLYGIRIHDDFFQWTIDEWHIFTPENQRNDIGHDAQKAPAYLERPTSQSPESNENLTKLRFGGRTLEEDETRRRQRVDHLLENRSEAIVRGDHRLANFIAFELEKTYSVLLDDNTRSWWIQDQKRVNMDVRSRQLNGVNESHEKGNSPQSTFPQITLGDEVRLYESPVKYTRSSRSLELGDSSWSERVKALVQERIHKREEGRYLEADSIRRELWHTYNVGVNDRLQQYSVGGMYDETAASQPSY